MPAHNAGGTNAQNITALIPDILENHACVQAPTHTEQPSQGGAGASKHVGAAHADVRLIRHQQKPHSHGLCHGEQIRPRGLRDAGFPLVRDANTVHSRVHVEARRFERRNRRLAGGGRQCIHDQTKKRAELGAALDIPPLLRRICLVESAISDSQGSGLAWRFVQPQEAAQIRATPSIPARRTGRGCHAKAAHSVSHRPHLHAALDVHETNKA